MHVVFHKFTRGKMGRVKAAVCAILHLVLPARATETSSCTYRHVDARGVAWNFPDLAALRNDRADYVLEAGGRTLVVNVCRPPLATCRPPNSAPLTWTPTAIAFYGPAPPHGAQCGGGVACTRPCSPLAWGALGGQASHWSLIDPTEPYEGLRLVHYGLDLWRPPASARANASLSAPRFDEAQPPQDEWGQPRPPMLTVDLVCEPTAPRPAAPLELVSLLGQVQTDVSLRLRSPLACPAKPVPPHAGTAPLSGDVDGSSVAAPGAIGSADEDEDGGGWLQFIFAFCAAGALAVAAMLGLAPLSLRHRLRRSAQHGWERATMAVGVDSGSSFSVPWVIPPAADADNDDEDEDDKAVTISRSRGSQRSVQMHYQAM